MLGRRGLASTAVPTRRSDKDSKRLDSLKVLTTVSGLWDTPQAALLSGTPTGQVENEVSNMQQVINATITTGGNSRPHARRPLAALLGGLALIVACGLAAPALADPDPASLTMATIAAPEAVRHPREKTYMKRQWGVEVLYVRTTAAGYMLEFRYKVLDPEKAKPLFERQTKPMLTHVETGSKFVVPTPAKTGALRNSNPPLANHTYWMFFANPGKLVKPGEHVNVEIGDFVAERLVVQ